PVWWNTGARSNHDGFGVGNIPPDFRITRTRSLHRHLLRTGFNELGYNASRQPALAGVGEQFGEIRCAQLGHEIRAVKLDGPRAEADRFTDLLARPPSEDLREHLLLATREDL